MKKYRLILLFLILNVPFGAQTQELYVNSHRIVKKDGTAFFYMADTAWELFHELGEKDAERYLMNRKEKGFNVIQAVILAENEGLTKPNANGDLPFADLKSLNPNEPYFKHVDWILKKAQELGLYIAVLPAWGQYWNKRWGSQPVIFDTPEKAKRFHKFIAARYKNQPNIIWVLGGDRQPDTDAQRAICDAMAEGIASVDKGKHLITFHMGGSSGNLFHNEKWLDFNMEATGHGKIDNPIYKETTIDYNKTPVKPCLNGEACYEDIPVNYNSINRRFNDFDVRLPGYWTVLAGAAGYAYGNNNIWQMWEEGMDAFYPTESWHDAMNSPGATQMGYLRKLFESRPFLNMVPDQDILAKVFGQDKNMIRSARGKDGSFAIIYTPLGDPVHINMAKLSGQTISGYWYNPREGNSVPLESFSNTKKVKAFVPPSSGQMTDWVLVLDDQKKNYPDPANYKLK